MLGVPAALAPLRRKNALDAGRLTREPDERGGNSVDSYGWRLRQSGPKRSPVPALESAGSDDTAQPPCVCAGLFPAVSDSASRALQVFIAKKVGAILCAEGRARGVRKEGTAGRSIVLMLRITMQIFCFVCFVILRSTNFASPSATRTNVG